MRILILSQYYFPEPVEKVHDLAQGLVQQGHDVQVITSFPCYPSGKVYPGYQQSLSYEEVIDGISVTRIPQFPDHSRSAWRRALYYLSFMLSAATIGLVRTRKADVMIVYQAALPIGLAAAVIGKLRKIPHVLDVVDLWPESVIASGMLTNKWVLKIVEWVAQLIYSSARHINVVTEGYKERLLALGVPQSKLTVIRHWMPEGAYRWTEPDSELAQQEGLHDSFNVTYAGAMGPIQDLGAVLKAAAILESSLPSVRFVMIGDGTEYASLVQSAREMRLSNVRFLGRKSPEQMPAYYALSDVLLVHLKSDVLSTVSIPSKTFAYMASGRPVIMGVEGEAARFVESNGFGIPVTPSDPQQIAEAVRWFYHLPPAEREEIGKAGMIAYQEKYSSRVQIAKWIALLQVVTAQP